MATLTIYRKTLELATTGTTTIPKMEKLKPLSGNGLLDV
jgi:hypothetical protein